MSKVLIIAQSFNPETGKPNMDPHQETIDISENIVFAGCKTLTDVAEKFMEFWNHFPTKQTELVLVQSIRWVV
jgi:hypothetical protein